jgi:hypothetical protein
MNDTVTIFGAESRSNVDGLAGATCKRRFARLMHASQSKTTKRVEILESWRGAIISFIRGWEISCRFGQPVMNIRGIYIEWLQPRKEKITQIETKRHRICVL